MSTAWALARLAVFPSPAPSDWLIRARNPTPMDEMVLPMSQFTVLVAPTAAVAWVPREPTMAVSMYWTAVCISCSSMVGHARVKITESMDRSNKCMCKASCQSSSSVRFSYSRSRDVYPFSDQHSF